MKIAVTGGSGQLGTLVLRKLAADRKITSIRSIDLRPPLVANRKVEAIQADIRDPDFARHLEGCDALVHLAFIVTPWAPRQVMDAVNVEGSKNVFAAAATANLGRTDPRIALFFRLAAAAAKRAPPREGAAMTLTALVTLFRAQVDLPGTRGFPARRFAAWLARP